MDTGKGFETEQRLADKGVRGAWRVLVVDDSQPMRELVGAILSRDEVFGDILEASDGRQAIETLEAEGPVDLIIMDLKMPGMDGFELINRLKNTEALAEIPVIVLSVDGRGEMKAMGLNIGASDYVVKPFDQGELVARAKLIIRRKAVQEELKRKNRELSEINERLKALAVTDELTKLYNRSHFFEKMEREMKRCRRHGIKMTLLLVDLDDFKDVNDTFGHVAGDEVLTGVASALLSSVRDNDAVGRYGGEEFIVCLVHTSAADAAVPAERIRDAVEKTVFTFEAGTYRTTASIGIAEYSAYDPGESRIDFLKRADAALYEAKRLGKNRVAVDPNSAL